MQVAGFTVELLAASRGSKTQREEQPKTEQKEKAYAATPEMKETASSFESKDSQTPEESYSYQTPVETADSEEEFQEESAEKEYDYQDYTGRDESEKTDFQPVSEETDWSQPSEVIESDDYEKIPEYADQAETESYQPATAESDYAETSTSEYQFDSNQFETPSEVDESQVETAKFDSSQFETFTPTDTVDSAVIQDIYNDDGRIALHFQFADGCEDTIFADTQELVYEIDEEYLKTKNMKEFQIKLTETHEIIATHKLYAETETEAIQKAINNESHTRYEKPTGKRRVKKNAVASVKETGKQWTSVSEI